MMSLGPPPLPCVAVATDSSYAVDISLESCNQLLGLHPAKTSLREKVDQLWNVLGFHVKNSNVFRI